MAYTKKKKTPKKTVAKKRKAKITKKRGCAGRRY
tara:strand:+ start:1970 stop:2071 length:102 start_codon:yes stop_codon:yes gene_type:complete